MSNTRLRITSRLHKASRLGLVLLLAGCAAAPPATPKASPGSAALERFAAARSEELAAARRTLDEVAASTAALAPAHQARIRGLVSAPFEALDGRSGEVRQVEALDTVTFDLPLSLRGTPDHDRAMVPVKTLSDLLAARRGSAEIIRSFTPADARSERIAEGSSKVKTSAGQDLTVRVTIDATLFRGFERIVVKGGALSRTQE